MIDLLTRWGEKLDRNHPLQEYPRPQMKRESYINLNGVWDYAIYPGDVQFSSYQGEIIVPFSPECILSGVKKSVMPSDKLYYRKNFEFKKTSDRVLLHFGAVDYECEVSLNDVILGSHKGGYFPFTFDVTDTIQNGENELKLVVTDPSQTGNQARGKQTFKRGKVWYTPQSGIWQTVWIEEVPDNYIESIKITPDIDRDMVSVEIKIKGETAKTEIKVFDEENPVCSVQTTGSTAVVKMEKYELWTPENPKLYNMEINTGSDSIKTYFGMRKFSVGMGSGGYMRFFLNNKPYFHNGLLDQGYWSDGMYTAPSDEAMIFDIKTVKDMGFNMLRKHMKMEPLRWYYHCDRMGILVWQDMISGGGEESTLTTLMKPSLGLGTCTKAGNIPDNEKNYKRFAREDKAGRDEYYKDAERLIDNLYNCVSICMWVPFNEGWGQFDALKVADFFREKDPTRTIDHASGWHDQGGGDVNSFHIYFTPFKFPKHDESDRRVIALTEFGGYSLGIKGHRFNPEKAFGYRIYKRRDELSKGVRDLYVRKLKPLIRTKGLSALVYTELSDVEDEINGLMTYDRKVIKVDPGFMKDINEQIKL